VRKAFGRDRRSLPFERRGSLLQIDGLFEPPASLRETAAACYLPLNSPAEGLEHGAVVLTSWLLLEDTTRTRYSPESGPPRANQHGEVE